MSRRMALRNREMHARNDDNESALDIIQSSYYIHGPLGDENIFAVLYVSLCYGPYTLL